MTVRLEDGKTYLTREGERVFIEGQTMSHGLWEYVGKDERGRITWRSAKGQHGRYRGPTDLIKEA